MSALAPTRGPPGVRAQPLCPAAAPPPPPGRPHAHSPKQEASAGQLERRGTRGLTCKCPSWAVADSSEHGKAPHFGGPPTVHPQVSVSPCSHSGMHAAQSRRCPCTPGVACAGTATGGTCCGVAAGGGGGTKQCHHTHGPVSDAASCPPSVQRPPVTGGERGGGRVSLGRIGGWKSRRGGIGIGRFNMMAAAYGL